MNTTEMARLEDWDEPALTDLVGRYVRAFRRFPSYDELVHFHSVRGRLALRLPARSRRRPRPLVSTR